MSNIWDADITLTATDAAALIDSQFPDLAPARLVPLGMGWDNAAYTVNDAFVFRFPQRVAGASLITAEARCLPILAPHLPLAIPVPRFVGVPAGDYPYPFAGYEKISGITACQLDWTDAERDANAVPLAQFLSALHHIPVDAETLTWSPKDDNERARCGKWTAATERRLRNGKAELTEFGIESLIRLAYDCAAAPAYDGPLRWLHSDLYPRHLLVNDERKLCGVIDWGDVHTGDPAMDFSAAFTFLSPAGREIFRAAYGPIDAPSWRRARYRALHYGAALTEYGLSVGDAAMVCMGKYALRSVIR